MQKVTFMSRKYGLFKSFEYFLFIPNKKLIHTSMQVKQVHCHLNYNPDTE